MTIKDYKTKAKEWYKKHSDHVDLLIDKATLFYSPSSEDRNQPELWKGEHWKWFRFHKQI